MNAVEVPLSERYLLSIEEAAILFHIGENRLRDNLARNPSADYVLRMGSKTAIKRRLFELYLDGISEI